MNTQACLQCGAALTPGARFCSSCGTSVQAAAAGLPRDPSGSLRRGTILEERYKVMNLLGEGGFSVVYGAIDLRLRTPCAIKENSEFDRSAHDQFIAEAQLLARLKHTHLTKVTDYFTEPGGSQFLVMEYVPGKDLERLMSEATTLLPWRKVVEWGVIVCDVLGYLHGQDPPIIHRDIKPANLRLTPEGELMVIDLGIAKVQKPGNATTRAAQAYSGGYSPVEQYLGEGTSVQSDLYALGATLYHLLSGRQPPEAITRLRGVPLPPLEEARSDLPPLLVRALSRAMAMEQEQRPPSANALRGVFEKLLDEQAPAVAAPATIPVSEPRFMTPPPVRPGPRASQPLSGGNQRRSLSTPITTVPRAEQAPGGLIWPGDSREMISIPAGRFLMGSDEANANEQPVHWVELPEFLIDRLPVTCAEYARFVQAARYEPPAYWRGPAPPLGIEDHPVVDVTLDDARAYAEWAGKRLPSEAEWEKAAAWHPGEQRSLRYPWGDDWDANCANSRDGGAGGTVPAGAYIPAGDSPSGVAELSGNVWEWTASAYRKYPYSPDDGREDPEVGGLRVTRGGSWTCSPEVLRAANRNVCAAGDADFELGFRCAADPEEA
ncbi:MAG TPA: SUMF1/EgtB/PvdO family nonheme iron enzyme [Herpetosiphonaceae bacterium]